MVPTSKIASGGPTFSHIVNLSKSPLSTRLPPPSTRSRLHHHHPHRNPNPNLANNPKSATISFKPNIPSTVIHHHHPHH
ncbi:hypothetical protein HanIR_Chr04g0163201 [Helianthus annuus]|nr:hypothetical protein HanIR_Chr04g0163201 [Helianthus annuus]